VYVTAIWRASSQLADMVYLLAHELAGLGREHALRTRPSLVLRFVGASVCVGSGPLGVY
jgi:hypothetical protein